MEVRNRNFRANVIFEWTQLLLQIVKLVWAIQDSLLYLDDAFSVSSDIGNTNDLSWRLSDVTGVLCDNTGCSCD